jgi:hypothetical protein
VLTNAGVTPGGALVIEFNENADSARPTVPSWMWTATIDVFPSAAGPADPESVHRVEVWLQ